MNLKAIIMTSMALFGVHANATGSFNCEGETSGGTIVSVSACVPHGVDSLCSGLTIMVGQNKSEIQRSQVSSFYIGKLESSSLLALKAYDENVENLLVDLVFQYKIVDGNESGMKRIYSRMNVKSGGKQYQFRDVNCTFE